MVMTNPVPEQKTFTLDFMNSDYDAWISEPIDDEAVAWFQEKMGLSRESLFQIFARAKSIVQELKPNEDLLDLTYDTNRGNWYIQFSRPDADGRWKVYIYRNDDFIKGRPIDESGDEAADEASR
jgi:hypothetical protein